MQEHPKATRANMKRLQRPGEVRYTALFIDDQKKLLRMFPSRHPKVYAHHSTNWYKPTSLEGFEIGRKSLLKIVGQAYDHKCFALPVENTKSKNKFPHITVSCSDNTAPAYSNELLEKASGDGSLEIFKEPFLIEVTEGYVNDDKRIVIS